MKIKLPQWPHYSEAEISAVADVLRSGQVNYWTGSNVKQFEQAFADYCGVEFGIAMANGSVALGAALRALDVGPGDEVIVTPRSFFASASEIVLAGATPIFADVDEDSQNITAASIRAVLSGKTKAIICVHLAGWPCDMPAIMELAQSHRLKVVEDCAQAHGATIDSEKAGSWGDIGVFSFCQDKIMSTGGEGGMVVTADGDLYEKLWSYKDHGKGYAAIHEQQHPPGFRWVHESFGTNLRMTEMQAAIGLLQLQYVSSWLDIRERNARNLVKELSDLTCIRLPIPPGNIKHSFYKLYAFVRPEKLKKGWNRDRIIEKFADLGIPGLSGSCPEIYREQAFASQSYETLPVAERLGQTSILLEVHPMLKESHIKYIGEVARQVLVEAEVK